MNALLVNWRCFIYMYWIIRAARCFTGTEIRHRNFRSYSGWVLPFTSEPVPYWNRVSVPNPSDVGPSVVFAFEHCTF